MPGLLPPALTSAYFDEVRDGVAAAGRRAGFVERRYAVGGRSVNLRFAGPGLVATLTRALSHLPEPGGAEPSLRILVAEGCVLEPPPPPWDLPRRRSPPGADQDARPALYARDARVHCLLDLGHDTLSMYDTAAAVGLFWARSGDGLGHYDRGAPLRAIFHWWALGHGCLMAHAGAVGTGRGGVLLAGKAGSGKSTAALACVGSGLAYAGDNDVLVRGGPEPFIHGVYCSAKLEPEHRRRAFPGLETLLGTSQGPGRGKELFFLEGAPRGSVGVGFPLRAVVLPRVTESARATIRRVSPAAGLLTLAPSTLFQLPGARQYRLQEMRDVLRRVPAYVLELGQDLGTVAPAIHAVLAQAERRAASSG
jgi:hypothetical protein